MKRSLLIVVAGGLLIGLLGALYGVRADDSAEQALPQGPLLNRAPDFSKWQILFSYPGAKDTPKAAGIPSPVTVVMPPRQLTVTRTKPLWHAVLVDTLGRSTESWFDGVVPYLWDPGFPGPIALSKGGLKLSSRLLDCGQNDFPDVEWVSLHTYAGIQTMDAHNCLVFVQKGTSPATVWIDATTRLPVRWKKEGEIRSFKFFEAPSELLSLPNEIVKIGNQLRITRENSSRLPPPGN